MLPQQIMTHATNVLSDAERARFFAQGYLALPGYVPETWLARQRDGMADLVDRSRAATQSDAVFMLEDGHSAAEPRLHRVTSPQQHHPAFWPFLTDPLITDLVADVVGPDVKFHHAKLNVKSGRGSRGIKWHQDIGAHPHTDFSPVAMGVYIDGCDAEQGPLAFVPGSHNGPLYSMYDRAGNFVIHIQDDELGWLRDELIDAPTGGPGTVVLLSCRVVHGSVVNRSNRARPLMLSLYSSADSFPYTPNPIPSPQAGSIVRGRPATYASFDLRPCEIPPDFSAGYRGAWAEQKEADKRRAGAAAY